MPNISSCPKWGFLCNICYVFFFIVYSFFSKLSKKRHSTFTSHLPTWALVGNVPRMANAECLPQWCKRFFFRASSKWCSLECDQSSGPRSPDPLQRAVGMLGLIVWHRGSTLHWEISCCSSSPDYLATFILAWLRCFKAASPCCLRLPVLIASSRSWRLRNTQKEKKQQDSCGLCWNKTKIRTSLWMTLPSR